jgi:hypothetical protein
VKKTLLLIVASVALFPALSRAQTATIDLEVGQLLNSVSSPIPNGALVQLLADTSGTFGAAPTPTSFTGGDPDEVLLSSFSLNDSTLEGTPGTSYDALTVDLSGPDSASAGTFLFLRWYPTLTTGSSAPGVGTTYGQFTSSLDEYPSDTAAISWKMPSAGSTDDLYFLTQSVDTQGDGTASNPPANSAGIANLVVAVVPEPSSSFLFAAAGLLAVGTMFLLRHRRSG